MRVDYVNERAKSQSDDIKLTSKVAFSVVFTTNIVIEFFSKLLLN